MDNKVLKILDDLIEREGGFVNHADDPGGATRYGITSSVARMYGYESLMHEFPISLAREIYIDLYWETPHFNRVAKLSLKVAEELLDTGVNMGIGIAAQFLQRALNALNVNGKLYPNVVVDGLVGPRTLASLRSYFYARPKTGELILLRALNSLQGARYIELSEKNPKLQSFVFGWLTNRVEIK